MNRTSAIMAVTPWKIYPPIACLPTAHAARRNTPVIMYAIQQNEINHTRMAAIHHNILISSILPLLFEPIDELTN